MEVNESVKQLLQVLSESKIKPYIVGGFVRDTLLGIPSTDYDIAVDKPIDTVISVLRKAGYSVLDASKGFGTVAVILNENKPFKVDIAEFRGDIYDGISRKPAIHRVKTIEEDLERRDFNINSMAFEYPSWKLIDPFNAQRALENRELLTLRRADIVFDEDPLRIMRAIRFAAKYNLHLGALIPAIRSKLYRLMDISKERIHEELIKGFSLHNYFYYAKYLMDTGILETIIPELKGYDTLMHDKRGHHYGESLKQHMLDTIENTGEITNPVHRIIMMLHDIGKMKTLQFVEGKIKFIGHDKVGAEMIRNVFIRLKFTNEDTNLAYRIVKYHLAFQNARQSPKFYKLLAKFFIEQKEDIEFIRLLKPIAEADQKENYNLFMSYIESFALLPKLLTGSDVQFVPAQLRTAALNKARYYQLIKEAYTKEQLLHLIRNDLRENTLKF